MENPTKMDDLGVSPIYGNLYFMTLESPQQAVSLTWTRRELGLEMAGCILNFWVQQHRECRVVQKKERNRENRNIQTGQQKNKGGTNIKNRKIQVVCLYADVFTACFSGDSSSQFVFFGESLFDSVGVFFWINVLCSRWPTIQWFYCIFFQASRRFVMQRSSSSNAMTSTSRHQCGGFHQWGYPKWMVYKGNPIKMDDLGYLHLWKLPDVCSRMILDDAHSRKVSTLSKNVQSVNLREHAVVSLELHSNEAMVPLSFYGM